MFQKILIANRGEAALRIQRACREMGIKTVAVHSTADAKAMHVRLADEAVCIGGPDPQDSYFNTAAILSAATITGADAIHPGYGFLSESANFAGMVEEHGFVFIGPSADHIRLTHNKMTARQAFAAQGVTCVPGSPSTLDNLDAALVCAEAIGYPVMLKASSLSTHRGIQVARDAQELRAIYPALRKDAKALYGSDAVYLERYLGEARHIAVQVLADNHGQVVHFGTRESSLQYHHRKLVVEAPAPSLTAEQQAEVCAIACDAVRKLGYRNIATVEFLYVDGCFYFVSMNARLQVEHAATEAVTRRDLVRDQIRISAGEALGYGQDDVVLTGNAVECRISAEDPETMYPAQGMVQGYHAPGGLGVRVDSSLYAGYDIPVFYGTLISELVVWGATRDEALPRLRRCLDEYVIDGIQTTLPLHQKITRDSDFLRGQYNINWLESFVRR